MRNRLWHCSWLIAATACGGSGGSGLPIPLTDSEACLVLGADYTNKVGVASVVSLPSRTVLKDFVPQAASGDPVLRSESSRFFIVNRLGADNVTVLDASNFSFVEQFSVGSGSNPQDIAVAGTKAYVVSLATPQVTVWDLSGAPPTAPAQTFDLSTYDSDGNPDAASIFAKGGRLYVTLELLDVSFQPTAKGRVLVLDAASGTEVANLELKNMNPFGLLRERGDDLVVSTVGTFPNGEGCLERISTGDLPKAEECLVTSGALGGSISSVAVAADQTVYLAVARYDENFNETAWITRLGADGKLAEAPLTPAEQIPTDLAYSPLSHSLIYNDAAVGGVHVLDVSSGLETTSQPLDIGLPPANSNGMACVTLAQ